MRCLCLFVHYFNPQGSFGGRSKYQDPLIRQRIVERALFSLRALREFDVRVCGHGGHSLVPLDFDLCERTANSQFLVFEVLQMLQVFREFYDYFLVLEDDILLSADVWRNVLAFDAQYAEASKQRWIFHPNRIEYRQDQTPFCIDLAVVRRCIGEPILFEGLQLQEHENPHSGMLLVNRAKLDIINQEVDPGFRGSVVGGPMASAFAHYHKPFNLFRVNKRYDYHTIQHLDPYAYRHTSIAKRILNKLTIYK